MKYKLIGTNDYSFNPVKTILTNRGIVDVQSFLNVDDNVINDWRKLKNIETAANCLINHLKKNSLIFIQIDADFDGMVSSALLVNYIQKVYPEANIKWRTHESKTHGVIVETVPEDAKLVIIPDAGSNQYDEHRLLSEKGIDVIVLDHHLCEHESEHAIVVNNQLSPDYPNKNFSGVGIVYKFCMALDHLLGSRYADDYLDLVAMGNIADSMDMRELETRHYVNKGLKKINNTFLKALIDKQSYSMSGKVNITNVAFYIAPLINSVTRVGTEEEKINVFKSLIESDEKVYYKKKDTWESIQVNTARQLANVRVRQNKLRDKGVELILERIKEKNLDCNKVLLVNVTGLLEKSLSGLVANKITNQFRKPVIMLRQYDDDEELFGGSARGYEKGEIKSFREFLLNTGKFNFCEGHDNAFGYEIHRDKIIELNVHINELLKDVEMGSDVYEVDFIIPAQQLKVNLIKELNKLRDIWGFRVEEPLLIVKDLIINQSDIKYPQKENGTVVIKCRDIELVMYRCNEETINQLKQSKSFKIDVVGRTSENIWNGEVKQQIIVDDFEIVDKKVFSF